MTCLSGYKGTDDKPGLPDRGASGPRVLSKPRPSGASLDRKVLTLQALALTGLSCPWRPKSGRTNNLRPGSQLGGIWRRTARNLLECGRLWKGVLDNRCVGGTCRSHANKPKRQYSCTQRANPKDNAVIHGAVYSTWLFADSELG